MYIIGITGLSCSGKTTLSIKLQQALGSDKCLLLSMDNYYKELTPEQHKILHDDSAAINFDTPAMIDFELLKTNLNDIKSGRATQLPVFDLGTCVVTERLNVAANTYDYVIIEGLFLFSDPQIVSLCNLKIWVETSDYVCALRRFIKFTTTIQGYTPEYVYNQCIKFVIPGQETFIKPVKKCCDLFLNGEKEDFNYVALIKEYVFKSL